MPNRSNNAGTVWARKALTYGLSVVVASTAATVAAMTPWSRLAPGAPAPAGQGSAIAVLTPLDTYLNLDSTNYSSQTTLATYTWPDAKAANAIVMTFDLSTLPAGAVIEQAQLHVSLVDSDAAPDTYGVSVHKITGPKPVVSEATGLNASASTPWTASTCCYNNTPLAQADISAPYDVQMLNAAPGGKSWTITDLVREWMASPATNRGLVLNSDATKPRDRYRIFASAEHANADLRPTLRVVYVAADVTPPTASISAPAAGAIVSGATTVSAAASDNVGVAGVQLLIDGAPLGAELTSAPYGVSWDSRTVTDGAHTIAAVVRDAAGNRGHAPGVTVTVANGVLILQPEDTYLNLDATSHGTEPTVGVYTWPDNKPANAIVMKFDLSALPAGVTIHDAALTLAQLQSDAVQDTYTVRAQKVVGVDPVISKATGMTADGVTGWTANPCCSSSVPLAQADLTPPYDLQALTTASGWRTWTITAMVQEWLADPASNRGVVLNADGSKPRDRYRFFASAENTDATLRPYLKITYSAAAGDTEPPAVAIAAPVSGATLTGMTTISANATDNVGVVGVEFKVDGVVIGDDTAEPFAIAWNAASVANGVHQLTATARDAAGHTTSATASVNVAVSNDSTRPNVSITAPSPRTTVKGVTTLRANASDNVGVAGVQFLIDGVNVGAEDTEAPYNVQWNSAEVTNGSHRVSAVARDAAGNTRTSASITITTSNDLTLPSVSLTSPAAGATVSGTITVRASASDNVGVAGVRFQVDGVDIGTEDTSSPYTRTWNTATAAPGTHSLTAIARDAAGNTRTSAAISVNIAGPPPADTTAPVISTILASGFTTSSATVTWNTNEASDSQVEYGLTTAYGTSNALQASLVTGHLMNVTGLTAGTTYHFRVRSKDAAGNLAMSGDFTFATTSVSNPPPTGGIAALFPGDVNIESHPDVVFVERFDEASTSALFNRWADVLNGSSMSLGSDAPSGSVTGRSLTIPWQGGGASDGGHLFRQLPAVTDTLYIRYYVKYPTSGGYQHSGIWMGGRNPSITWPDPQAGQRPGGNDRFSAAAEQDAATGRFDHYNYWTGMRLSGDGNYWGNKLLNDPDVSVQGGQWTCVEHMVKLNNPVSASNGEHAIWLNGTKVSHLAQGTPTGTWSGGNFIQGPSGSAFPGFQWRTDASLNLNWLWLQVYAPNDPAGFQGTMKFAQVVAAKDRIGCMPSGAPPPPVLDTTPPTVSLTAPAAGAGVSGTVTVNATASDNVGVAGVQFKVDGVNVGAEDTSSPYSIGWDTTAMSSGTHVISAVARDAAGNTTTSGTRSVSVSNGGGGGGGTSAGVKFDSTWDNSTGTSNGAVTDGGRWPNYWEFNGGGSTQLLSVVGDGPGGHNALRVQQRGSSFAANVQVDNVVPQSTDYYLRFYMRNDDTSGSGDHIVTVDTWQYANLTFVRKMGSSANWDFVMSVYGCGYTYPIGHWGPTVSLARGQWYRFEYFVDFIDSTHVQVHPRVYDANGALLFSDAEYKQSDFGGASWNGRSDWSLQSYYAAGHSFCVDPSFVNDLGFGNNGQFGAGDTGQYWYFSGVQVRTDTWPGAMPALSAPAPQASATQATLAWALIPGTTNRRRPRVRRVRRSRSYRRRDGRRAKL